MSDDPEEAGDGLVPQGARALAIKSTQLVTRGLQDLEILQDSEAICDRGEKFLEGDGVEQDYAAAVKWFRVAAERGHGRAQHNLALMYEDGEGVSQDYFEAAKWYRMAAEQGHAGSQNNLGGLHEAGLGVAKDYAVAIEWYSKGAEGGDAVARSNLQRLTNCVELENYRQIVGTFTDFIAQHSPLIGDSSLLPYPKKKILYAIKFVVDDLETKLETEADPKLVEMYESMIPTLNHGFTCLADVWQDIAPEDKDAIAKLSEYQSFPEWALPLKDKYIDEERASSEASDAFFQVMKDKVAREKASQEILENKTEDREIAYYEDAVLAFDLGKSHITAGRLLEALGAFKNALKSQKDSGLYAYAVGLTSALVGDDVAVFEQEETLSAKGLTPLSDDLFQFLNKHADHIAELGQDDEFIALMCQLVESKIHAAELLTSMASEFDRVASED